MQYLFTFYMEKYTKTSINAKKEQSHLTAAAVWHKKVKGHI